jgi:hypothetical protein
LGIKGLKMSFKHHLARHASASHHGTSRAPVVLHRALVEQRGVGVSSSVAASEASVSRFQRSHVRARSARPRCTSLSSSQRQRSIGVFIVKSSSSIGTASVSSVRMHVRRLRSSVSPNQALKTDALKTARGLA